MQSADVKCAICGSRIWVENEKFRCACRMNVEVTQYRSDYSELVDQLAGYAMREQLRLVVRIAVIEAATAITTLQAELAEARNQALEDAAQEADKWFPANSAAKYPTGGIAAAIRAMKDKP